MLILPQLIHQDDVMEPTKNIQTIQEDIAHFWGTENFWKFTISNSVLTDGAQYIATNCEAFWLFDLLDAEMRFNQNLKNELYLQSKLTVDLEKEEGLIVIDDMDDTICFTKSLSLCTFPLEKITIWSVRNPQNKSITHMLPSEY